MAAEGPQVAAPNFRRVGVVAKASSAEALRTATELDEWLARRGLLEQHLEAAAFRSGGEIWRPFLPGVDVDLVVVLGGDGTLLSVARALDKPTPILGVNMGSLGFLTEVHRSDLYPALVRVLSGQFTVEERSLLQVEVRPREGEPRRFRVLNDAACTGSL